MKKYIYLLSCFAIIAAMAACGTKGNDPGWEYAPNMYDGYPYEADKANPVFADGKTNQHPVEGSIAIGATPFHYENTNEDYERAGRELKNPLPLTEANLAEGKRLFISRCSHCHGAEGKGDGTIILNEKFPPPPAYQSENLRNLSEGKLFFSITYGKNLMGPHAQIVDTEERWKIVHYIQQLQKLES